MKGNPMLQCVKCGKVFDQLKAKLVWTDPDDEPDLIAPCCGYRAAQSWFIWVKEEKLTSDAKTSISNDNTKDDLAPSNRANLT